MWLVQITVFRGMRMTQRNIFRTLLPALVLVASLPASAIGQSEPPAAALESITAGELTGLLRYYSSDWFEGRATGTPGFNMATDFLAAQLAATGVKPAGSNGTYFQKIDLVRYGLSDDMGFELTRNGTATGSYEPGRDYAPGSGYSDWRIEAPLVFAGYGISAPDREWDDYENLDVSGKAVVIIDSYPGAMSEESPLGGRREAMRYASTNAKTRAARERGAVAVIRVPNPTPAGRPPSFSADRMMRMSRLNLEARINRETFPQIQVGPQVIEDLFEPGALQKAVSDMASRGRPVSISLRADALRAHANMRRETVPTQNVVAVIEGTDLKDEYVVLGAHSDHVGRRGDLIMNGADDDGSGSVMLLELAEAFMEAGVRPRRTVVLGWWAGEEIGLLGAWHYTRNPVGGSIDKTVALIQMDMIGRNEEFDPRKSRGLPEETAEQNVNSVNCIGYSWSSEMQSLIARANEPVGLQVNFRYDAGTQNLIQRSDHWHFLQQGVPVAFLFTGIHPDYHEPTDTWDKINYPKMERIGHLAFRAAWELANTDNPPKLNPDRRPGGER
jgi:hypothetical protein